MTTAPTITTTGTGTTADDENNIKNQKHDDEKLLPFPKGLDVLHATSTALVHALRDVLLDSDFENAMKSLTAWIPVADEDLLMKVARAEWRRHQTRGRLWEWDWEKGEKKDKEREKKEKEREKKEKEIEKKEAKDKAKEKKDKEKKEAKEKSKGTG